MQLWLLSLSTVLLSTCPFGRRTISSGLAEALPLTVPEQLVISALIDNPYFAVLELTACSSIANFNEYTFRQEDSLGGTHIYSGASLSNIAAGTKIYVATMASNGIGIDAAGFLTFFGLTEAPTNLFFHPELQFFGHWDFTLLKDTTVVDTYVGPDKIFDNGWAVRKQGTSATTSFAADDWIANEDTYFVEPATNADATDPVTLGTYTCPVITEAPVPPTTAPVAPTAAPVAPSVAPTKPTKAPVPAATPPPSPNPTLRPTLAGRAPHTRDNNKDDADRHRPTVAETPTPTSYSGQKEPTTKTSVASTNAESVKPSRQPRKRKPTHKPRMLRSTM